MIGLRRGVRLVLDEARDAHVLLFPEGVLQLNDTAAAVVELCDGRLSAVEIQEALEREYAATAHAEIRADVDALLAELTAAHLLVDQGEVVRFRASGDRFVEKIPLINERGVLREPVPFGLLAELTYRCPLRCPYCSNPVGLNDYADELSTDEWRRVFDEARALGVLQVHLSGGEPAARRDLTALVAHVRGHGMYSNLVTSGLGLSAERLDGLVAAGLDHVQLSIQDATAGPANEIAGITAHERKRVVAGWVTARGLPLSVNVVLHRHNTERVAEIAHLAAELGAERLELAHTQYYGWGLLNRASLMPSRAQIDAANEAAAAVVAELGDSMEIVYVRPDYYDGVVKPCMNGWGSRQLVVAPNGDVLPCPAASVIPDVRVDNVRSTPLDAIWYDSDAFTKFRGTAWMREPCRSCPRKEIDFGGCRCQAFQLLGDAAATDPACSLSPDHGVIDSLVAEAGGGVPLVPRRVR